MAPTNRDVKELIVSGCQVQLAFSSLNGRWSVQGIVRCGLAENSAEQAFDTGACATREAAEQKALDMAAGLLGNNVDRSTSRVLNWS